MWPKVAPHLPRTLVSILAGLLLCGTVSATSWVVLSGGPTRAAEAVQLVIPDGTGASIAAGSAESPIPRDLSLVQGDVLLVQNNDRVDHNLGPYVVRAGETLTVPLSQAGSSSFLCSFHPSGGIGLSVAARNNPLMILWPTLALGLPMGVVLAIVWAVLWRLDGPEPAPAAAEAG